MMAARVQALIGVAGGTVTDTRVTHGSYSTAMPQSAPSVQSATIKASVRQYRTREMTGLVQQGDREVRTSADLSFTPRPNDQVMMGGQTFQVVSVNTRSPFSKAAIHLVQVRGGNGLPRSLSAGAYAGVTPSAGAFAGARGRQDAVPRVQRGR
jgi:hypothetical protein